MEPPHLAYADRIWSPYSGIAEKDHPRYLFPKQPAISANEECVLARYTLHLPSMLLSSLLLPKLPRNCTDSLGTLAIASLSRLFPNAPAALSSKQAEGNYSIVALQLPTYRLRWDDSDKAQCPSSLTMAAQTPMHSNDSTALSLALTPGCN